MIILEADTKGVFGSNDLSSLSANQRDLVDTLTKLWNNQDRLTKKDLEHLDYLSKK